MNVTDKLIEIAHDNGAKDTLSGKVMLSPDQLRATVEQVCAPLDEAIHKLQAMQIVEQIDIIEDAISNHRAIMGDKE